MALKTMALAVWAVYGHINERVLHCSWNMVVDRKTGRLLEFQLAGYPVEWWAA